MDEPSIPLITPGEVLFAEFMEPMGLSRNRLGLDLGVAPQRIGEIIKGRRSITTDTALRLAHYFQTTPEFWLNLQMRYDLRRAEREGLTRRIRGRVHLPQPAPTSEKKAGA